MNLKKEEILVVLGAGESGVGTAILAKQKGFGVFVSDFGKIKQKYKDVLKHNEIEWEEGGHTKKRILSADLVMKSPGIPDKAPILISLKAKGIPVISEIEFASRYTDAQIIGITGSNGKTTTTAMTAYILKQAGINAVAAGNIGDSFAKNVAEDKADMYVLELSSFQLDGIVDFAPHIAVITNITPDHLDRYDGKFEKYIAAKFRIAMNQTKVDYLIYDGDDEVITNWLRDHPVRSRLLPFSVSKKLKQGAYVAEGKIMITIEKDQLTMQTEQLSMKGVHNTKNAMAAATISCLLNIRKATIRESLGGFQGVEHRLENVLKINHVMYINDSKATNVNSTFYALGSMMAPTVWIVGGEEHGNDYTDLFPLIYEKVKSIICLGKDNRKLMSTFGNMVETIIETQSMDEAVKIAYKMADKGDNVLLSPACKSFDLFEDYEDRGRQFKEAVRNL